jgi:hypothetical protein
MPAHRTRDTATQCQQIPPDRILSTPTPAWMDHYRKSIDELRLPPRLFHTERALRLMGASRTS